MSCIYQYDRHGTVGGLNGSHRSKKHQKLYFLGYFDDEREAARAYDEKAVDLFGEFARLNDVDDDEASVISEEP